MLGTYACSIIEANPVVDVRLARRLAIRVSGRSPRSTLRMIDVCTLHFGGKLLSAAILS